MLTAANYFTYSKDNSLHQILPIRLHSIIYLGDDCTDSMLYVKDAYQIMICLKGNGKLRLEGEEDLLLDQNQVLILRPDLRYQLEWMTVDWQVAFIRFYCTSVVFAQFQLSVQRPSNLNIRMKQLLECLSGYEGSTHSMWKSSEWVYSLLMEIKMEDAILKAHSPFCKSYSDKIVDYISEHYCDKLTLTLLSKNFGYTSKYLNKLFKAETGFSIQDFILKIRMERAAGMLKINDFSIEEVAERVGMEWRTFHRNFLSYFNTTPGQYRKTFE
ncbi:AraC family transcriptional regulator [Paenibacillus sp. LjRoot153]|uniref:helix-turn-helix transcriptional regulator n=1 Tax=Paenibacillus sp. LjRoot153 TaxID=3342270 RepID=UPI003ECDA2B2